MSVYFIRNKTTGNIKIGFTKGNANKRMSDLQVGCDGPLELVAVVPGTMLTERALHAKFASERIRHEWFCAQGAFKQFLDSMLGADDKDAWFRRFVQGLPASPQTAVEAFNEEDEADLKEIEERWLKRVEFIERRKLLCLANDCACLTPKQRDGRPPNMAYRHPLFGDVLADPSHPLA